MLQPTQNAQSAEAEMLGDISPLLERIGSPEGLARLAGTPDVLAMGHVRTVAELRAFLGEYHVKILRPLELPAIQRAFVHAGRNELRELLAFDHALSEEAMLRSFACASRLVGLGQLQRLRPMRDQRLAQRYLAAAEAGAANAWHTLVYGLTLAVFYLPLRQGLIGYAQRTTGGFIQSAARSLMLSETDSRALSDEFCARLPAAVEPLLPAGIIA